MEVETALFAARQLSVDVANLSYRLALQEAEHSALHQMALALTPGTWRRSMHPVPQEGLVHDPDETSLLEIEPSITITGEDAAMVERIVSALQGLM